MLWLRTGHYVKLCLVYSWKLTLFVLLTLPHAAVKYMEIIILLMFVSCSQGLGKIWNFLSTNYVRREILKVKKNLLDQWWCDILCIVCCFWDKDNACGWTRTICNKHITHLLSHLWWFWLRLSITFGAELLRF